MMEGGGSSPPSATTIPPLLFRNLIASVFVFAADNVPLFDRAHKSKIVQLIRYVLVACLLFILRFLFLVLPLNYPNNNGNNNASHKKKKNLFNHNKNNHHHHILRMNRNNSSSSTSNRGGGDGGDSSSSGIERALSQLLSLVNDIPVSSRKYQVVRSLAETLIHDNHKDGVEPLCQVNRTVLSKAFSNTLSRLDEAATLAVEHQGAASGGGDSSTAATDHSNSSSLVEHRLSSSWLLRALRSIRGVAYWKITGGGGSSGRWSRSSAEKLGAEVLWLAEKLASCGYGVEAVGRWASATHLAWLSLSVEPRLQASLVKVSALLFKHAKHMGMDEEVEDENKKEQQNQTKMKMLMSWLPLLCRASNGADVPILSIGERAELERVLEETIQMLKEEDQEKVLSLWLHRFSYCASSDWPNLNASYARWCNASRKLLLDRDHENL